MANSLKLSILDYSPVDEHLHPIDALAASVRLAQCAERNGFQRFWVSEHHGAPATASNSPEILMSRIASATHKIRVGSGGVLLPNYSSLKIAENYQLLEALFPGRIDLGFGRAPGADRRTSMALNDEKSGAIPYGQKVEDLLGFVTGNHKENSRYNGMRAHPMTLEKPHPFVLGASGSTAEVAANAGLGFTFAHFINPRGDGPRAAAAYREAFKETDFSSAPSVVVAVFVAIGKTTEQAEEYASAFHLWLAYAESANPFDRVPSIETTRGHRWSSEELAIRMRNKGRLVYGTAGDVLSQLCELAAAYGTDEVMINLMMPGEEARLNAIDSLTRSMANQGQALETPLAAESLEGKNHG
ncbi:hypothetical protein PPUJ20028_06640 [Pseudomonas putida]|nr:LLM class flavin-dependent oxidoreductase [Pseudomonas putida]GLO12083.1 hypothetical protein PPUJ20028_06640 [Pseudomonas putida]HDS0962793.1 LLM class flavin-dependent oxidoreductase [Pseudomonas putida]HDS0990027.1 LLM class flavin-dependent oxidoreductase [Pseudomonas putida]